MSKTLQAYLICALWSSTCQDDEPLDSSYDISDFSPEFLKQAETDIELFESKAGDLIDALDLEQIGHDLWLTRNHHGAGFWDRGLGETGDKLTELAHSLGEVHLYISDSGQVEGL
jgi:hypothetical protein